ncbi:6656_t:CDS:2, partial [Acaulospora colombiana]
MGESRTELLQWLNELLDINYTKVEQCGTGAAYCQILDSIFGDVPMARVKFAAKHEYESLQNYKIMQNFFKAKKIDKNASVAALFLPHEMAADLHTQTIPVDKLVKCKMQDNLEFLQWIKRYWDQNYSGEPYNAAARRKGQAGDPPATIAPVGPGRSSGGTPSGSAPRGKTPVGGQRVTQTNVELLAMQTQVQELTTTMEGLEKERDFYFAKVCTQTSCSPISNVVAQLRDIEILVQQEFDAGKDDEVLKEIQKILYSTE